MKKIFTVIAIASALNSAVAAWVNVTNFGAVGDGMTDDTPAIQNAINSLTNGGTVYIPAGTYVLGGDNPGAWDGTSALDVTNPGITFRGDGASTILVQTNYTTTLIYGNFFGTNADLILENLKLQGDMSSGWSAPADWSQCDGSLLICYGQNLLPAKGVTLRNVYVEDECKRNTIVLGKLDDVVIENCQFLHDPGPPGSGNDTIFGWYDGIGSLRLINNYANGDTSGSTNMSQGDYTFLYEQAGQDLIASGNTLYNYHDNTLESAAARQTYSDNIIRTTKPWNGICVDESTAWTGTNYQVTVANNICEGEGNFFYMLSPQNGCKIDATIENNTMNLGNSDEGIPGSFGVYIATGGRVVISGNNIENYYVGGLWVSGAASSDSSLVVQGNNFTDCSTNGIGGQGSAVVVDFGGAPYFQNINIQGNTMSGYGGTDILIWTNNVPINLGGQVMVGNNMSLESDNSYAPPRELIVGNSAWLTLPPSSIMTVGGYTVQEITANTSGAFSGDGSGLTNLNAAQLTSGTIPLAQLPTNIIIDYDTNVVLSGLIVTNTLQVHDTTLGQWQGNVDWFRMINPDANGQEYFQMLNNNAGNGWDIYLNPGYIDNRLSFIPCIDEGGYLPSAYHEAFDFYTNGSASCYSNFTAGGSITAGGLITGTFSGDGSGLTNLNASQMPSNVVTTTTDPIGASFILSVSNNSYVGPGSIILQHANNIASNTFSYSDNQFWVTNWFATPFTDNLYGVDFVYRHGNYGTNMIVTNQTTNYVVFYSSFTDLASSPTGMVYVAVFR